MISNSTIDKVKDLAVEEVIGRYVDLKKAGASFKACCPLHGENTPSLFVTPAKNIFHCFGCGAGGDAIEFVMLHEGLTFIQAVENIASAHGIEIKNSEETGKTDEQRNDEEQMYAAILEAQRLYVAQLS